MADQKGLVVALAGGVGGAKLALGLSKILSPEQLTIIVNTGDDDEFHGLHVSPDLDTMTYTLAGLVNSETGWGLRGDTFVTLQALGRLGASTWFNLGDQDLALHLRRTQLIKSGWTLTEVTREICTRLGIHHSIIPITDDPVRTRVTTNEGEMAFQEYFVQRRSEPTIKVVRYEGASRASIPSTVINALDYADALVFCPSNPVMSISPILEIPGIRDRIANFQGCRLAISPIIGGKAVKGPAAQNLEDLGHAASATSVARYYQGLCDVFILDLVDNHLIPEIVSLGFQVETLQTMMANDEDKVRLAKRICELAGVPFNEQ